MTSPTRPLRWFLSLSLLALAGCSSPRLPACVASTTTAPTPAAATGQPLPEAARGLMVGIDGSGSMLGLAKAPDPTNWTKLLQAINLAAQVENLPIQAFRIGGGQARPFGDGSVTPAADACFFEGCDRFSPPVPSTLQTLWSHRPASAKDLPLRLMVSDLEVNQNDITQLVAGIRGDLARGAGVGVLGLRLPFQGRVFDGNGRVIHTGKAKRPVYLLATGRPAQVRSLLGKIRELVAQKGIDAEVRLSVLDPQSDGAPKTLVARADQTIPASAGASGLPLRLGGVRYSPATNPDYRFVRLDPEATGVIVATARGLDGGVSRSDPGLMRIESIALPGEPASSVSGVRVEAITLSGSQLQARLGIDRTAPSGLLRAVIPRGGLPEPWWLEWDRNDPGDTGARDRTDGLLLLLTTLGQQLPHTATTPAVSLCLAIQRT
jgi:hypothetical protein